ncbi:eukaryotic translation initiation factor 2-alpha kinase-like [Aricia agestis]|uniref:eukaryotic translation initiation factor 2-alpha kinase-like n=1 Tax=Aricia agestis TaxID=91739 RepID=UPI001C20677E|nr:eukaryotic translation initiation factor 2-alpha kinase-like [Aricia agestis]
MRTRCWQVIHVATIIFLTCFVSCLGADDIIKKLPFCNPHTQEDSHLSDLVIVSTLDGRITAFSTGNGKKAWDFETQPLLSSNLHHVELTSGGKWVRLVPSLRGTLYSLSGDSIEPLPFDAEQLLTSSFKYSDEMVIAGARETRWVGVDARTGLIVYECNSSGCNSEQQTASAGRDILVLRRHSNTVRALDPRSGTEKWNFSVSDHQMALSRRECAGAYPTQSAVAIAVALPEGVVAVRGPDKVLMWQQKLDAPVAGMWRLQGGVLQHMDVLWEAARASDPAPDAIAGPSLYLGVHDTQLYIQESQLYAKKLESSVSIKSLPWKLKQTRPLITSDGTALSLQDADPKTLTAVALHGSAAAKDNSGFFLYLQDTCDETIQVDGETEDILPNNSDFDATEFNHVHVHVYSLWFWWKEVLVIAVSSALVMNLMIWPRFFPTKPPPTTPLPINQEYIVVERHYERPVPVNNNTEYMGRFDSDFEPLMCLGKGGFGVVFKAKNKIDHCLYAVKRITLPRTESKRQRVLREVLALATLEHEHIVRYFNSWIEEPPPQWQETWDKHWMQKLGDISELPDDYFSPTRTRQSTRSASVMLDLHKDLDPCMDVLEYDKKRSRSLSCNDSFVIEFDEKASKIASQTIDSTKSPGDITPPNTLSKHMASGDNDDSFIVFQKTMDEQSKDLSNKILEKVKHSDSYVKTDSSSKKSKKKGHKRHWSLDMCLPANSSKMYLYIQMQLCQSDSLHDWLRKNHRWEMRRPQVKILFSQIVSAVEYVHKKGLIHRDLKPSNIFFAQDGRVKVGDFGLVTAMADNLQDESESTPRTRHTSRVGTHLYMSPEQLAGRAYSFKVDIYSLGMVLFELLCPFGTDAERVACLTRLRAGAFPKHFPETHPDETEVLKLMLNHDPNERPTATGVKARAPLYEKTGEDISYEQLVMNNSQ